MFLNDKPFIVLLILTFSLSASLYGQELKSKILSLSEATEATITNNRQIKITDYDYRASLSEIDKMKSLYLPQLEASLTGSANNLPIQSFGSLLQQGAITEADFLPTSLNSPSVIANLQTQLTVNQPILNLDARAAKSALIAKSKATKEQGQRTKEMMRYHVAQAYLHLQLSYEAIEVLEKALSTTEANLKLTRDNVEAGYLQNADILTVQLRINEIQDQLFVTANNIDNISDQISFLMGTQLGVTYKPADKLIFEDHSDLLLEIFPQDRSDINAMNFQINAQEHMLNSAKNKSMPRINAFGSYELNNSFDLADSQHGFLVGVQASWKIFNGNKNKSTVQKSKIELEKSRIQLDQMISMNEMELEIAKRQMLEAKNKITLAESAIETSKEALRIKTNRYAEGLEKTTDILIAETKVSEKQLNKIKAIHQYRLAYTKILNILEQH